METSEEKKCCGAKKCGCFCHKMGGLFWIALGVIFFLNAFNVLKGSIGWMIAGAVALVAGLQTIAGGMCKCCDKAGSDK